MNSVGTVKYLYNADSNVVEWMKLFHPLIKHLNLRFIETLLYNLAVIIRLTLTVKLWGDPEICNYLWYYFHKYFDMGKVDMILIMGSTDTDCILQIVLTDRMVWH